MPSQKVKSECSTNIHLSLLTKESRHSSNDQLCVALKGCKSHHSSSLPPEAVSVSQGIKLLNCSRDTPHEQLFHTKTYLHIPSLLACIKIPPPSQKSGQFVCTYLHWVRSRVSHLPNKESSSVGGKSLDLIHCFQHSEICKLFGFFQEPNKRRKVNFGSERARELGANENHFINRIWIIFNASEVLVIGTVSTIF